MTTLRWRLSAQSALQFIPACGATQRVSSPSTLWRGDELIPGAVEALELLRSLGKQVLFMTNNSMKSRAGYLNKFVQLGVPAHVDEIYCSSYCAAAYLDSIGFDRSNKAYVVGEVGIMDELAAVGIKSFGGPSDNDKRCSFKQEMEHDHQVGAVVCGVDPGLSYYKIQGGTEGLVWTSCPVPTDQPPPSLPPAVLHKNKELLQTVTLVALAGQKQLSAVCVELGLPADCRVMVLDVLDAWCLARVVLVCQEDLPTVPRRNSPTTMLFVIFEGFEGDGGLWLPLDSPRLWKGSFSKLQDSFTSYDRFCYIQSPLKAAKPNPRAEAQPAVPHPANAAATATAPAPMVVRPVGHRHTDLCISAGDIPSRSARSLTSSGGGKPKSSACLEPKSTAAGGADCQQARQLGSCAKAKGNCTQQCGSSSPSELPAVSSAAAVGAAAATASADGRSVQPQVAAAAAAAPAGGGCDSQGRGTALSALDATFTASTGTGTGTAGGDNGGVATAANAAGLCQGGVRYDQKRHRFEERPAAADEKLAGVARGRMQLVGQARGVVVLEFGDAAAYKAGLKAVAASCPSDLRGLALVPCWRAVRTVECSFMLHQVEVSTLGEFLAVCQVAIEQHGSNATVSHIVRATVTPGTAWFNELIRTAAAGSILWPQPPAQHPAAAAAAPAEVPAPPEYEQQLCSFQSDRQLSLQFVEAQQPRQQQDCTDPLLQQVHKEDRLSTTFWQQLLPGMCSGCSNEESSDTLQGLLHVVDPAKGLVLYHTNDFVLVQDVAAIVVPGVGSTGGSSNGLQAPLHVHPSLATDSGGRRGDVNFYSGGAGSMVYAKGKVVCSKSGQDNMHRLHNCSKDAVPHRVKELQDVLATALESTMVPRLGFRAAAAQQATFQVFPPGEVCPELSLFGIWPLLTAVQPGHGSVCYLPSQSLIHGTIYLRDGKQRQQVIRAAVAGQMPPSAATTPSSEAPELKAVASGPAAGSAAAREQQQLKQSKAATVPRAAADALAQRYGIALVNKRRDVSSVLNQWVNLLQQWLSAGDAEAAERALRGELTWLCACFSWQLQGMACQEPGCVQVWEPFRKALQRRSFQGKAGASIGVMSQ
eukprot:gene13377-13504_t